MSAPTAQTADGSFAIEHRIYEPQTSRPFRVDDWFRLPAATVEIHRHGTYIRTARVETATPDSSMLWLCQEGVEPRMLIDKHDGYEVWIEPWQLYPAEHHA